MSMDASVVNSVTWGNDHEVIEFGNDTDEEDSTLIDWTVSTPNVVVPVNRHNYRSCSSSSHNNTSNHSHNHHDAQSTMTLEEDLEDVRSTADKERRWKHTVKRAKVWSSVLLVGAMVVTTVRVNDEESRMTSVRLNHPSSEIRTTEQHQLDLWKSRHQYKDYGRGLGSLQNIANLTEPQSPDDVPFFLHFSRSGGNTVQDILGTCLGMTIATDGTNFPDYMMKGTSLRTIYNEDGAAFVNVDLSTLEGIERASRLGLLNDRSNQQQQQLAHLVVSPYLYPVSQQLFSFQRKGRAFALLRHPVHRAVSWFHYAAVAHWEPAHKYDPDLAYVSLEMYARSKRTPTNPMVRILSNTLDADNDDTELTAHEHLEIAKSVLQHKFVVGLLERKGESFSRFQQYFGWQFRTDKEEQCRDKLLHWSWSTHQHHIAHPTVEEGSTVWELLYRKNELDIQLYEFAQDLFVQQAILFPTTI